MTLSPGKYRLKLVVRENEAGRMGSFETDFTIPDLKSTPLKLSSIVMASQLQAAPKKDTGNPLVQNGQEIVPSVTRVFSNNQHLYLYYEVYDPAKEAVVESSCSRGQSRVKPGVRVMSNVEFFQGDTKTYETPLVKVQELTVPGRKAAVFQLDVPLSELEAGLLYLPGQRDRRRRRSLCISPSGHTRAKVGALLPNLYMKTGLRSEAERGPNVFAPE